MKAAAQTVHGMLARVRRRFVRSEAEIEGLGVEGFGAGKDSSEEEAELRA